MYKLIENELIVKCDVDDTLVQWIEPNVPGINKIEMEFAGRTVYLTPHDYHIELIKMYKERGYHITVWSANGYRHAKRAVDVLNLQEYVDVVQSKPIKWVDDSNDAAGVLGTRVFCPNITKPEYAFIEAGAQMTPGSVIIVK